ncbi:transposase [Sphingobium sp. H33]|uniref:Transposase n=2 Tax=Sphingobium nicotianae TaxID=2782607 RepID=A0A9X1AI50_9SPHN|nr:transposase [Sphingobium nicotianae]
MEIFDLPRTRPVQLRVRRRRFECLVCKGTGKARTFSERGPDIHERYNMTHRLYEHVLDAITKKPLALVQKETGVPAGTLWNIAHDLAVRLWANHKFPTPRVLSMDGVKLYGKEYMVIGDAHTGIPIGFLETIEASPIRAWVRDNVEEARVEVFVADLHKSNTSVGELRLGRSLRVADKWHVIEHYQRVLSRQINSEIDRLRKSGRKEMAKTLWDLKPAMMAVDPKKCRWRRYPKKPQREFDLVRDLKPILRRFPLLSRAYWGRYDFLKFYSSEALGDAMIWLNRFHARTAPFSHTQDMVAFNKRLTKNWELITNYFLSARQIAGGEWKRATTSAMEQQNREIRKRLSIRHGVQNFALMRMVVLYAHWHVGGEIVLCSGPGCSAAYGPVAGPPVPPEIRAAAGIYPQCSECAGR